jgi:nucleoside-diphosphate-sugar epimerase
MGKRILVTGASGCIGHYLAEALIQETDHELFLWVRNPAKLQVDVDARPGVQVLTGDLHNLEPLRALLPTIDAAILAATSWGGRPEVYQINVDRTLELMGGLDRDRCQRIFYFSTASILDRHCHLLPEAGTLGTDYIRSKYQCAQALAERSDLPPITTLYPTLVLGGDDRKPYSHLTSGLPEVVRYMPLIRRLRAEGSFHFIHGRDIAQIVLGLLAQVLEPGGDRPPERDHYVMGTPRMSLDGAIDEVAGYLGRPARVKIPLSLDLANVLIKLFRIQMAEWDRFCLQYRHFTHDRVVDPSAFGRSVYCPTLSDVLKLSGIAPK